MLLLVRRAGEEILIDKGRITVKVVYESHGEVIIGINAPKDVDILRKEVVVRNLALAKIKGHVMDKNTPGHLKGRPL